MINYEENYTHSFSIEIHYGDVGNGHVSSNGTLTMTLRPVGKTRKEMVDLLSEKFGDYNRLGDLTYKTKNNFGWVNSLDKRWCVDLDEDEVDTVTFLFKTEEDAVFARLLI